MTVSSSVSGGMERPRLRDLGIAIGSHQPGAFNAITDVAGVRVGHATIIEGSGALSPGHGPVRTGCTVVLPRPTYMRDNPCFSGAHRLNGNGELTGLQWVRESGLLTTPIAITNTHSVGVVRDALVAHDVGHDPHEAFWSMPVVGETWDGLLNDINGHHVTAAHVAEALTAAASGPVPEGSVGGGTGMICHQFKGGIGTSSRLVAVEEDRWTVGVLVQANHGRRADLRVDGVAVTRTNPLNRVPTVLDNRPADAATPPGAGSIIVIVATDAPLLPDQCQRLAARAVIGIARSGGGTSDASGDLILAFSTGNDLPPERYPAIRLPTTFPVRSVPHQRLDVLFEAAADACEEAIINAMLAAPTMVGRDGITAYGLDADLLVAGWRAAQEQPLPET